MWLLEALRLKAYPKDTEALANMEKGFQAFHRLLQLSGEPGVLPRYADAEGHWVYADTCEQKWHAGRHTSG